MRVKELFAFIQERHSVYVRRAAGAPKPWTEDKILQRYRFCNVYRELDTVTVWIKENWRQKNHTDPELWFAMTVARLLNLPASLAAIGYPVPWNPARFKKILRARKEAGERIFNGAYMIHADAVETGLKSDYLADFVLTPMWKKRKTIQLVCGKTTLAGVHRDIMTFRDMGSFMAAQVVADAKFGYYLSAAPDWWTWAAPGPGSLRGMSRVEFGDLNTRYTDEEWRDSLNTLLNKITPLQIAAGMTRIAAQDLQNCLCEFDKYERVRLGEGRPKQLYPGT